MSSLICALVAPAVSSSKHDKVCYYTCSPFLRCELCSSAKHQICFRLSTFKSPESHQRMFLASVPPVTLVTASLAWIWRDHSTLLTEDFSISISIRSELMDEIIADFNTQYAGAVPPSRKTIWCKDDTDQWRHSLGFTLDRWRESPAFLAFLVDLKILNGYRKCAQMERARNSDSETHVEK